MSCCFFFAATISPHWSTAGSENRIVLHSRVARKYDHAVSVYSVYTTIGHHYSILMTISNFTSEYGMIDNRLQDRRRFINQICYRICETNAFKSLYMHHD